MRLLVVVPLSGSTQARLVNDQGAPGASSVTVYEPAAMFVKLVWPWPPDVVIWNGEAIPPVAV